MKIVKNLLRYEVVGDNGEHIGNYKYKKDAVKAVENVKEEPTKTIVFPTEWKTSRGHKFTVKFPEVFIEDKENYYNNLNLNNSLQVYILAMDKEDPYLLKALDNSLEGFGYNREMIRSYIKRNKPDPKIEWVSFRMIEQYLRSINVYVRTEKILSSFDWRYDNHSMKWASYNDAVKLVGELKRK